MPHEGNAMKYLLVYCFSAIAYIRNFFDEKDFDDKESYGLQLKQLIKGRSPEANRFLNCIDVVVKSIEKGYVRGIQLGISLTEKPGELSEVYLFEINNLQDSYNGNESQIIKDIILTTQSFEPLPPKKTISMKVLFTEECSSNYQPSGFKDCSTDWNEILVDSYGKDLGNINYSHNGIKVKLISNLNIDGCFGIDPLNIETDQFMVTEIDWNPIPQETPRETPRETPQKEPPQQKLLLLQETPQQEPPQQEHPQQETVHDTIIKFDKSCECGFVDPKLTQFLISCNSCTRQIHQCCYADQFFGLCFSCQNSVNKFKPLMKLRAIHKLMLTKGLDLNDYMDFNDPMVIDCINFMFKNGIMRLSEILYSSLGKPYECMGKFTVNNQSIYDSNGWLLQNGTYTFIFGPRVFNHRLNITYNSISPYLLENSEQTVKKYQSETDIESSFDGTANTSIFSLTQGNGGKI